MKLFGTLFFFLILILAISIRAEEEFDEEIGEIDDVEEADIEDEGDEELLAEADVEGEDEGIVEADDEEEAEEGSEVSIQHYFPDSVLTAGKVSEVLVSVKISESSLEEYTFGTVEGGFHYPQDWSYKVQNFSAIRYGRTLTAGQEATFMYPFMAAELAGGRSYGLQLNLHYQDNASPPRFFSDAIYNETVEVNENMDNAAAEQFFMFLTFAAFGGIGFAFFASKFGNKKKAPAAVVETGTSATADSSWIPKEHLKSADKTSPKTSPKSGARRRKAD